jgi:hypothetical protein
MIYLWLHVLFIVGGMEYFRFGAIDFNFSYVNFSFYIE